MNESVIDRRCELYAWHGTRNGACVRARVRVFVRAGQPSGRMGHALDIPTTGIIIRSVHCIVLVVVVVAPDGFFGTCVFLFFLSDCASVEIRKREKIWKGKKEKNDPACLRRLLL